VAHWQLPVKPDFDSWGYGTAILPVPGTSRVLLSLPTGGPRTPWCTIDVTTGQTLRGTGMPGYLRSAIFPPSQCDDPRPWVLGAYGLGRLEMDGRAKVTEVVRKSLGSYQTTLIDLGEGLLGVGHWRGKSLLLLSAVDSRAVKRLRVPGPGVSYRLPDGRVRILGLHYGQATDIDVTQRAVVGRVPVPYGTSARHIDNTVIALLGQRHDIRIVDDAADARPGGTVVLRVRPRLATGDQTAEPPTPPDLGWDVEPTEIAVLDADDLTIRRSAPAPADAAEILGTDPRGHIVATTRHGLILLHPLTLAPVGSYHTPRPIDGAALSPGGHTAALLGAHHPATITALTWATAS